MAGGRTQRKLKEFYRCHLAKYFLNVINAGILNVTKSKEIVKRQSQVRNIIKRYKDGLGVCKV